MSTVTILHENPEWLAPLAAALDAEGVPWRDWYMEDGAVDLTRAPSDGVFFSRMSASAHTRGHEHAVDFSRAVLGWLEGHGRRVVNGSRVLELEVSKVRQHQALAAAGIETPRTVVVVGRHRLADAAEANFPGEPVILKPNRGGKGLGVQLFQDAAALAAYADGPTYEAPVDGVHLLQTYLASDEPVVTRVEFVGGRYLYAVRVETGGGFELCPADACAVGDTFCPVGDTAPRPGFTITDEVDPELVRRYEAFLAANGIEIAGIEFIRTRDGRTVTYDINTNTNYNRDAEERAGRSGPRAVARFLADALAKVGGTPRARAVA